MPRVDITETPFGVVFHTTAKGLPVEYIANLPDRIKYATDTGFDPEKLVICASLQQYLRVEYGLRCVFAVAWDDARARAWEEYVESGLLEDYPDAPGRRWLLGTDTGQSSMTIFRCHEGLQVDKPSHPQDADDFGHCFRLLKLFPHMRSSLPKIAEAYGEPWTSIVMAWDTLEVLAEKAGYSSRYGEKDQALSLELTNAIRRLTEKEAST